MPLIRIRNRTDIQRNAVEDLIKDLNKRMNVFTKDRREANRKAAVNPPTPTGQYFRRGGSPGGKGFCPGNLVSETNGRFQKSLGTLVSRNALNVSIERVPERRDRFTTKAESIPLAVASLRNDPGHISAGEGLPREIHEVSRSISWGRPAEKVLCPGNQVSETNGRLKTSASHSYNKPN